ncbi:MAG: GH92 family glycosyl hydrolase [Cytophagales bacterium]|nr:GH92 family glycosyl hydrolase [Cytophagales bacterium]
MKKYFLMIGAFGVLLNSCSLKAERTVPQTIDPVQYANPLIGTAGHGHTHPSAMAPLGMVQLGPSQYLRGWDWTSGYNYSDSVILGFSHKHLSGTGIGDLGDILFQPVTGPVQLSKGSPNAPMKGFGSLFSHDNEETEPGYYRVKLDRYDVGAELTATERTGFHQYTFPKSNEAHLLIDLIYGIGWDAPTESHIKILDNRTIVGYRFSKGWASDQRQYFAAVFEKPFVQARLFKSGKKKESNSVKGVRMQAVVDFNKTKANEKIRVKVGLSGVSTENALANLKEEIPHWDFEKTRTSTRQNWTKELSKIQVESKQKDVKDIFYSALYHTMVAPTIDSDVCGEFRGADRKVHKLSKGQSYTLFSLWDTYRALHPLYTVFQPERVSDIVNSMLEQYEHKGLLPVWQLEKNETNTMVGYSAVPVIVDAYLKGFPMDEDKAFEAVKASAMQNRNGLKQMREKGYIPADMVNEAVAKQLEYCISDWAIAQMAKKMGKTKDYEFFAKRAESFVNIYDPSTGFFRGKMADGSWRTPFDPRRSEHRKDDYCEGNGWQYLWLTPQHPYKLIELLGGDEAFAGKLSQLFEQESVITGQGESPDISGLIGQYAHGNEPGHHTSYLFAYAGKPWKTQQLVRKIMATQYRNDHDGYAGNEDCGQMSAWYVLSAMGFYPVNPASGIYVIGSPAVDYAKIELPKGKTFEIFAKNNSSDNIYIQSAKLNGKPLERSYFTHKELVAGGRLELQMGSQPNKLWASQKENRPAETAE